jgi:hypothetical protein
MDAEEREMAELAAHYLRLAFKVQGMAVLRLKIPELGHMGETVRATYKVWLYDHARHESGDHDKPTLQREEGVAHFIREALSKPSMFVTQFVPKPGGRWEHNYNAVSDSSQCYADAPYLDEEVARQWKHLNAVLAIGLNAADFPTEF